MLLSMLSPIARLPLRYHRFARYFISGGLSTLVHYTILTGLVEIGRVDETVSTATGYVIASAGHYMLSYHWAFRSGARHAKALLRFVCVAGSTLVLNTAMFWVLNEALGLWYLLAQAITTGLLLFVNYALNARFTFSGR